MIKLPLLIIKTVSDHGLVPRYPADYGARFLTRSPLHMIVDERPSVVHHQSYSLCWQGGDQLCFGADVESVLSRNVEFSVQDLPPDPLTRQVHY